MDILEAQKDMRLAHVGGSTGVFSSGLVWLIAGIMALTASVQTSILVFFFGGMLIYPLGVLFAKLLKRSGQHRKDNPLARLAMEGTLILFAGLFIAYSIYLNNPERFYPIMLLIIGSRYMVFQSIYGMRLYWALGIILIAAGAVCMVMNQPFQMGAIAGGVIELIFAIIIFKFGR